METSERMVAEVDFILDDFQACFLSFNITFFIPLTTVENSRV
jgi:hypothetical protein